MEKYWQCNKITCNKKIHLFHFQKIIVKFPTPGQKFEVKYN